VRAADPGRLGAWSGPADVGARTRFQAASISKVATALVTLRLCDQGVVDVDADINALLEPWELHGGHRVKVLEVLGHTGGLNVSAIPGVPRSGGAPPSLSQRVSGAAGTSVSPPPRRPALTGSTRAVGTPCCNSHWSG
jgi:CubicO group peptidase (beta-lactamase class C family)